MSVHDGGVYKAGRNAKGKYIYKARWYPFAGAKRKEKNFPTRKAAQQFVNQLSRGETNGSTTSFEVLVKDWRAERSDRCKLTTQANYDRTLRVYLNPVFGDYRDISAIIPSDIQRLNQQLIAKGKSQHVRTTVLGTLRGIFRYAIRNHKLIADPTSAIPKPGAVKRDVYILTTSQQQRLLNAAPNLKFRLLFAIAMYCGLRQGELLGLKWSAIDFERGTIVVREQWTHGAWSTPKSGKTREVPFNNQIGSWFRDWRPQCDSDELVFPSDSGTPIDPQNLRTRQYHPTLARAGIADELVKSGRPTYRFHDLRHCFASLQLAAGASIYDVQRAMGHASIQITEALYGHLVPGFYDDFRARQAQITADVDFDSKPKLRAVI